MFLGYVGLTGWRVPAGVGLLWSFRLARRLLAGQPLPGLGWFSFVSSPVCLFARRDLLTQNV